METIIIKIDFHGEVTINKSWTRNGPFSFHWFKGNDLTIEAKGKKVIVKTDNVVKGGVYTLPAAVFA